MPLKCSKHNKCCAWNNQKYTRDCPGQMYTSKIRFAERDLIHLHSYLYWIVSGKAKYSTRFIQLKPTTSINMRQYRKLQKDVSATIGPRDKATIQKVWDRKPANLEKEESTRLQQEMISTMRKI